MKKSRTKNKLPKILVILGPTAVGKSNLAVSLAKKFNGEIISADSRQVYKSLDIGTGKITKKEMRGVPHHLLDIASPKTKFNVAKWQKLANQKVGNILSRGKLPIICGGTGFYIDSITKGVIFPEVPPNEKLRNELGKKSLDELISILKKLDPKRLKNIDRKNPVRLVRAIEIAKAIGKVPKIKTEQKKYQVLSIGLNLPDKKLKEKINERLIGWLKKGLIFEVKKLRKDKVSWKRIDEFGLEYKYIKSLIDKKISTERFVNLSSTEIWHFAKRQRQWFMRDKTIRWFDPRDKKTISLLKKYLS